MRESQLCKRQCGKEPGLDSMVNICEPLRRRHVNKPKVLKGLNQKASGQVRGLLTPPSQMSRHRRSGGTYPVRKVFMRNTETPYISLLKGKRTARRAYGCAGTGCRKKRMPPCNRADRDSNFVPTRKSADVRQVFLCERICVIFFGKESK